MIVLIIAIVLLVGTAFISVALAMLGIYATHKTQIELERDNL